MSARDNNLRERVEEFRDGLDEMVEDTPDHMDYAIPASDVLNDLNTILEESNDK